MSGRRTAAPERIARFNDHGDPRQLRGGRGTGAGFMIGLAGRQIRFGPVAFWIGVGSIVIMAGWSVATATYFAFRDDVLKGLLARQAEEQSAYEDRIAELRTRIDRTTGRQLLDQEEFERKLDDLLRRETSLESRAAAMIGIVDGATTGSVRPPRGAQQPTADAPAREHHSLREPNAPPANRAARDSWIGAKLARAASALDRLEQRQSLALAQIEARYENRARKLRGVFAALGLTPRPTPTASGGPFVPTKVPSDSNTFERALVRIAIARDQSDQLSRSLAQLPVRKPVAGEIDISSPFGVRADPFLHVAAMHTGIDFRGDVGDAVHATAAGTVTAAGWSGGYGKMVEIDHGNGLSTRYGHLSQITVDIGDKVRPGQIVGRMGSTGRSTGPHVHYETRIDGEPVNPQKFLNAGASLDGG